MRTLAHRYGGGAFAVGDQLVYSRASDGRVCRLARDGPGEPTPITPSDERTVLGGPAESVFQPSWRGDELYAVSDRTGWWNIYRVVPDLEPVVDEPAELGFSSYEHASLATDGTRLVAHAGSPTQLRSILRWTPGETPTVLRASEAFTFADCNYRGSTGHGRAYRDALDGEWGRKDTADCINVARYLGEWGVGDPDRTAIRGASAGGFATLAALTVADTFDAGSSYFGVADLRALAEHTHKFESRYLDTLVGPLPNAADTYADRSPLEHADQIDAPTLLLQAGNDAVVPPAQAERMMEAFVETGTPCDYVLFPEERHGFEAAATKQLALETELGFYRLSRRMPRHLTPRRFTVPCSTSTGPTFPISHAVPSASEPPPGNARVSVSENSENLLSTASLPPTV